MSDPPGLPSALGIEAVETISEGNSLTVRVTGRWRRRRPEWRGPAILVVEAHGTRYRFPAMPEPPSVTGTMPGTWRMSFSVAPELGPHLSGRSWLQLGSLIAPLPVFAQTKIGGPSEGEGATGVADDPEPERLPERRRPGELAIEHARRRADEAEQLAAELALRVDQLERALEEARAHPARLERARRTAEQSAHAEAARRAELEEQLAEQERALEDARARAAALARRVEELEDELRRLRRTADEAVHLAAGERAARLRVERLAAEERPAPEPAPSRSDAVAERASEARKRVLADEDAQMRRAVQRARAPSSAPRAVRSLARAAEDELQMRARRAAAPVERERARRVEAEERVAALERTLAERTDRWARAYAEIDHIRDEIGELRRVFAHIESAAAAPPREPAGPAAPVQADKLSEALTRLREQAPPPPEPRPAPVEPETLQVPPATSPRDRYVAPTGSSSTAPPPSSPAAAPIAPAQSVSPPPAPSGSVPPPTPPRPARPWLAPIFSSLLREDPLFAGQLILHLLPAWTEVHPLPVACDLILGDRACVQVTVGAGAVEVRHTEAPRRARDVHFQVTGDLERLARTVMAGRMRRRLGRGMARVSGDQEAFGRMALLVSAPLTLAQLYDAGVRLDPVLAFRLAARMIVPAWTVGERFTIAHRLPDVATADAHLVVKDGAPASAGEGEPPGPADATIIAPADAFPGALTAATRDAEGRAEPLAQLAAWLERAQSG